MQIVKIILICIVFSTAEAYSELKPVIEDVSVDRQLLHGETSVTLKAVIAGDTNTISRVWAEITPPDHSPGSWNNPVDLPLAELYDTDNNGTYEGRYDDFTITGTYLITFYAMNTEGVSSSYYTVIQEGEADDYEEDDTFTQANVIVINDDIPQYHYFHNIGDEDWVKFYGRSGQTYSIKAGKLGPLCDPIIEVYGSDGKTIIPGEISGVQGKYRILSLKCPQDGVYFVRVRNSPANIFGTETAYELEVYFPYSENVGHIIGYVSDCCSGESAAVNIRVVENSVYTAISDLEGLHNYKIKYIDVGTYTLAVDGYETYLCEGDSCEVTVKYSETASKNICVCVCSVCSVCINTLSRAVLALKVAAGINTMGSLICFDKDNDGKIGLEDAVYILQKVSEIRK